MIEFLLVLALALGLFVAVSMIVAIFTPVPYVPSKRFVVDAMIKEAHLQPGMTVVDIGAGDGRILQAAMNACDGIHAIGYECMPSVYLYARLRLWLLRSRVDYRYGNAFNADLSNTDVVFTYLSPSVMRRLSPKFAAELKPGARVVSHAFPLPNREADDVMEVECGKRVKRVYVYTL